MSVIYYRDASTLDKTIRQKRFRKKKTKGIACYVVLTHRFVWTEKHIVSVEFETYENDKLVDSYVIEKKDFYRDGGSAEEAFKEYIERIKKGKIVVKYGFELSD